MPSGVYERKPRAVPLPEDMNGAPEALQAEAATEAVPDISPQGEAAPPKKRLGRPPGSKNKAREGAPKIALKTPEAPKRTVRFNPSRAIPPAAMRGASTLPALVADATVTVVTKGKVDLAQHFTVEGADECERLFKEFIGLAEIECSPLEGWLFANGMLVGGSALVALFSKAMEYRQRVVALKKEANHATGPQTPTAQPPQAVPQQPPSSGEASA